MNQEIFKKFSDNLKKVLIEAERLAQEQNTVMSTEHQLMALLLVRETLASEILANWNITIDRIQLINTLLLKDASSYSKQGLSADAKKTIQIAVKIASEYNHYFVDCEHLLLAILSEKKFNSYVIIERIGVKPSEIEKQIKNIFQSIKETQSPLNQGLPLDNMAIGDGEADPGSFNPMRPFTGLDQTVERGQKESILDVFAKNITAMAHTNKLDPVIGREDEMQRLIQVLSRRTKNNPILVGEPGVGKTSIVEGLADRINSGRVPANLMHQEIMSLDMGSLIAGTMYRGQFESRIKKILAEIKKRKNIVLFIDEIHTVVGAGSTEGSIDAANLLKPMLAKGELRLIGSTTFDEYKKHIEKDPAFERRLQPITVFEPSIQEAEKMLMGIKEKYEKHHGVKYTDKAIEAAVSLSKRYINDRYLPDKAIDLIDEAAAATNKIPKEASRLTKLKKELRQILRQKDDLIIAERYKEATLLREREIVIEKEIDKIKKAESKKEEVVLDENDIANVVAKWTGVPVSNLTLEEKKRYLDLESRLKKQVIGQDEAVHEIAKAIKRARVGIANPSRPAGSFIFLGPTGVGKTLLAKILAKEILGSEKALIKIDMSEFMERHNVSRLIGAPAGYIGYEEGGKLTEIVRKNPYSVILLDEIEKAHPEVFNILLQVMEDGELTDARGRKVDFKNTILIMTSNLGTEVLTKGASIGFQREDTISKYQKLEKSVLESVERHFKPEFVNRIDKIIVFKPLDKRSVLRIVDLELSKLVEVVASKHYKISFTKELKKFIMEKGYDPSFGARPVRKAIADYIEVPLSEKILTEEFLPEDTIVVDEEYDKIILKKR